MKIIRPRKELRTYVRYYWTLETNQPFSVLTFPIGCPQMIFHRRTPLFIPELSSRQDKFTISGQVNFPAHIASDGDTEMIVAVFYPHTIGRFIDTPPRSFTIPKYRDLTLATVALTLSPTRYWIVRIPS